MITEAYGNLLEADADALVNTVNTVGVMGKGIALQFKRAFPEMFRAYARAAKAGDVELGKMHVWPTGNATRPRYVINFPTKGHWRSRAHLPDIERGLADLIQVIGELGVDSIAVPPLGCGNGGLDWADVEPLIRDAFARLPGVAVLLYPPGSRPGAENMRSATPRPQITPARASLIRLLARYAERVVDVSQIEVQKLLYFLQEAGEPLRLNYVKGLYGPYADNLRHALTALEGHYIVGFGDGSAKVTEAEPMRVLPGADEAAGKVLLGHAETQGRIDRVLRLAEGFESAYGMELLATVHWLAGSDEQARASSDRAADLVRSWSARKESMFTPSHIRTAWDALKDRGWLDSGVAPGMA